MEKTITLDPETCLAIERTMRERGLSSREAVNEAIRAWIGPEPPAAARTSYTVPRPLGPPRVDLTSALRLADALEDDTLVRRHSVQR